MSLLQRVPLLVICVAWDIADFIIGPIPVLSDVMDLIAIPFGYFTLGKAGLLNVWELVAFFEPLNMIDGFVPTMTIAWFIGVSS